MIAVCINQSEKKVEMYGFVLTQVIDKDLKNGIMKPYISINRIEFCAHRKYRFPMCVGFDAFGLASGRRNASYFYKNLGGMYT